jgi:hypothetical protein
MAAARGSSEARTKASLVAGRALSEQGEKREAVKTLEHTSKSVDEKNAVALILSAIDISAKDIEDKARARFVLEQYLLKHPDEEEADQGVIRLLAITGQRAELAEYLVRKRNTKAYSARLRRAAELFMTDAHFDRAADAFEALYRETDAIDDLFLLVNALRQAGHYETVIKLLEERQNEDERVQQMLKQDLSAYASMLKQGSLSPGDDRAVKRSIPPSLYPEESREILDDTEGLEEKLSSAFSKLRKK